MADAEAMAVAFARVLRGIGLAVPTSTVIAFAEAIGTIGVTDRDGVYWSGRATLVRRPEDIAVYDRAFAVFWEHAEPPADEYVEPEPVAVTLAIDTDDDDGAQSSEASDDPTIELRFSLSEVLRHKDFAAYDNHELAEAHRLMARMRLTGSPRRSLRLVPTARRTARPDLRRTVRAALRTEGEAVRRHFRKPATRHRRLVLLLDVSGSMEPYARALLRFVQAAVAGRRRVEAFALGTRLTRITRGARFRAIPTSPSPGRPIASSTGQVARASATGCAGSTTSGACAAWHVAPTWSSSPTAGIVAIRTSWPRRCSASLASPTASSGSTR